MRKHQADVATKEPRIWELICRSGADILKGDTGGRLADQD